MVDFRPNPIKKSSSSNIDKEAEKIDRRRAQTFWIVVGILLTIIFAPGIAESPLFKITYEEAQKALTKFKYANEMVHGAFSDNHDQCIRNTRMYYSQTTGRYTPLTEADIINTATHGCAITIMTLTCGGVSWTAHVCFGDWR